jgi:hypothetical protein
MRRLFVASLVLTASCASFTTSARKTLAASAHVLVQADEYSASLYEDAATEARQVARSLAEYQLRMEEYDELETTLRAAHIALLAAEAGLDVYDETGRKIDFVTGVACVAEIFADLGDRLGDITGESFAPVAGVMSALKTYGGECHNERFAH